MPIQISSLARLPRWVSSNHCTLVAGNSGSRATRTRNNLVFVPGSLELFANSGGTTTLPGHHRSKRLARAFIPCQHGLALVGNTERSNLKLRPVGKALANSGNDTAPDLSGVLLDPAGAGCFVCTGADPGQGSPRSLPPE